MKTLFHITLLTIIISYPSYIKADITIKGSYDFKRKVENNLFEAERHSSHLAHLIQNIKTSPSTITIRAITNDKSTWHKSGKKSRSHTKALDNKSRGSARKISTNSIIYINVNRITKTHKTYNSGILIHELVHALDLANGKYHGSYPIREKRAVFFQNIWRDAHSKKLRTDYHGRFKTNEYQEAKKSGKIKQFINHYFAYNTVP